MPATCDALTFAAVATGTGAGATIDVFTRRIPNVVSAVTTAAGLVLAAWGLSEITIGAALAGFIVGMLAMMPGHLLGATGAGDVKLMGAVGALLGPSGVVAAFLYTAIVGGILALAVALARGRLSQTIGRTARLVTATRDASSEARAQGPANRFPYGPAIAIGSTLAMLG